MTFNDRLAVTGHVLEIRPHPGPQQDPPLGWRVYFNNVYLMFFVDKDTAERFADRVKMALHAAPERSNPNAENKGTKERNPARGSGNAETETGPPTQD